MPDEIELQGWWESYIFSKSPKILFRRIIRSEGDICSDNPTRTLIGQIFIKKYLRNLYLQTLKTFDNFNNLSDKYTQGKFCN